MHLIFEDLDGFGGIFLAVKVDIVNGVFLLHSIIHVNDLQNKRGQFIQYQDYFKQHSADSLIAHSFWKLILIERLIQSRY